MKLNNKGFAITGILYTLFIMFLLILVSVLGGLSTKKNMLEQSIISEEDSFVGKKVESVETAIVDGVTTLTGKYIFSMDDTNTKCTAYLTSGVNIEEDNITYIPNDCNLYEVNFTLDEVYSFEKE